MKRCSTMYPQRHVSVMLLRQLRNISPPKRDFSLRQAGRFRFSKRQINISNWNQSIRLLAKACAKQFEFIIAQRVRRTVQIFHLYSKVWDETALREFIRAWHQRLRFNRRQFLIGSAFVTTYNWDKERISDEEMYSYSNDIEKIYILADLTVMCPNCNLRLVIDDVQSEVKYCKCAEICKATSNSLDAWEPFLERQNMLVWRKCEPNADGLYSYKVYGYFNDVSAEDFLQVQIDINYRKDWDHTAKELIVLDTDPTNSNEQNGSSEVIYWEMIWPKLFANRDYVYQRRWIQDKEKGIIIIISKVTEHPEAPIRPDTHRVSSYWSYMVIKPCREFNEAGIEFSLTYFDDPGINIPSAITSWVAMRGFPDYLCKMREATKHYKTYKSNKENNVEVTESSRIEDDHDAEETIVEIETEPISNVNDNIRQEETESNNDKIYEQESDNKVSNEELEKDKSESSDSNKPDENQGFFSYFFITRLFA